MPMLFITDISEVYKVAKWQYEEEYGTGKGGKWVPVTDWAKIAASTSHATGRERRSVARRRCLDR